MNIEEKIGLNDVKTPDKERLWKGHAKSQCESGLSKISYCRKHHLNYDQFLYWTQKYQQKILPSELLPVKLTKLSKINCSEKKEALCTLMFKNGHELKIHDHSVLSMLFTQWS